MSCNCHILSLHSIKLNKSCTYILQLLPYTMATPYTRWHPPPPQFTNSCSHKAVIINSKKLNKSGMTSNRITLKANFLKTDKIVQQLKDACISMHAHMTYNDLTQPLICLRKVCSKYFWSFEHICSL